MTTTLKVQAHAATIDIVDSRPPTGDREGAYTVIVPNKVFVDGAELYLPAGTEINMSISDIPHSAVAVTATFFARRVRVGYADELGGPIGELAQPETTPAPCEGEDGTGLEEQHVGAGTD
ncbi:hypothetical protein ACFWYW_46505 [Nonomuraea sp. NPDC059023]|uniref:hypothetical protein n=1 Tax=unclassified Nonomuraea TaxID=2593643 RepID=UPI003687DB15